MVKGFTAAILAVTLFALMPIFVESSNGASLNLVNPSTGNPATQDPVTVGPGNTLTVNILLTSGSDSVAGTGNDIAFDTSIFSSPSATAGQVATDAGKFIATTAPSSGVFRVSIVGFNTNVIADGVVAVVTFTVATDATPGTYTLTNVPSTVDPNGVDITTTGSDATVNVIGPPTVEAGIDQTVNEGDTVSLDPATFTPLMAGFSYTATVNWGDGTSGSGQVDQTAGTVSGSHVYADDGIYVVTVTVTASSMSASDTLTVIVNNVAPTLELGPDQIVNEGDTVTFGAETFSDPGSADILMAFIDWGDGTVENVQVSQNDGSPLGNHVYMNNGTFTVSITITDDDGGSVNDTLSVVVNNTAPVVDGGGDQTTSENDLFTLIATFTDASNTDTHTATIDWDDGSPIETATLDETDGSGEVSGSHVYQEVGTYILTVTVTDNDSDSGSDTLTITVVPNVAPVVDAGADRTAEEGDVINILATFTDPESVDTHTATIDWGDGTPVETGILNQSIGTVSGSHVYVDDGAYTVTVTVIDDDGGVGTDSLNVTVNNTAPTVDAGADQTANEGDAVILSFTFIDPSTVDTHTGIIDWGDGTIQNIGVVDPSAAHIPVSHVYADNGTYNVTLTITDDEGASGADILTITVANVAPILEVGSYQVIYVGDTVRLDPATFYDLGIADTHTATIDWGDGTIDTGLVDQAADTIYGSHVYAVSGNFSVTVTVTITDDDGASSSDTFTVISCIPGDVDGDTNVDILDIIKTVKMTLEIDSTPLSLCAADLDSNSVVNILDAILLMRLVLDL
jgi:PKD repeat protein